MGSELVNAPLFEKNGEETQPRTLTDFINDSFAYYLTIGMDYVTYWHKSPWMAKAYREAYEMKKTIKNQELWLQGMYFYEALCDVAPILHAFSRETKPTPYVARPYPITPKEIEEEKLQREKEQQEKIKSRFQRWATGVNKQIKLREEKIENEQCNR